MSSVEDVMLTGRLSQIVSVVCLALAMGCTAPIALRGGTVGGSAPIGADDYIPLGPRASVRATLASNVPDVTFTISGVDAGHDIVLPPTNIAKVLLPVGGVTIEARARCYRTNRSYLQIENTDSGREFSFTFSNVYRVSGCVESSGQPPAANGSSPPSAPASARLAWVIAGSTYGGDWPELEFVKADADNMTSVLQHAGFRVVSSVDRSRQQLLADEANMAQLLKSQIWSSVIVYISGHGEGIDGENYFVPTSAPDSRSARPDDLFSIARIRRDLYPVASSGNFAIVLVDACRSEAGANAHPMFPDADQAVLVNYSASPGQSAYAGSHGMSAWSAHDSPHFSNWPKYICEQRLLVQHLREALHQRAQPLFAHGGDKIVQHATLTEQ